MSTTGLTAQAYGAKNPQALARALVQPLLLAFGAGALIALCCVRRLSIWRCILLAVVKQSGTGATLP